MIDLKGGDDAVLLIHGLTGSPFELKNLARHLNRAGYTVKGPCLAGHGTSIDDLLKTRWQDWYATVREEFDLLKKGHRNVFAAGLCMGALFSLYLAYEVKEDLSAIAMLSTTLSYDGWSLPWYKFLLPVSYYPPLKYFYSYEEREPYGIKDERMRKHIAAALQDNIIAYSKFPSRAMHELFKHIGAVKKIIPEVKTPTLLLHALEDDIASTKNADYVERHIGSSDVRKIFLDNSYHMLTLDFQKDEVAAQTIRFFNEHAG
ncbi:MAG: alpha/beta fold hydrolase [Nitrospirae bacterium]|nr:MAG: alpha/beta fold hydrolase [Nitrospirota bacterium]